MKGKVKQCLALCLCAVMLMAFAAPASSAEAGNAKRYQGYCCVGDSSSCGYGITYLDYSEGDSGWGLGWPKAHFGVCDTAFPGLIRDTLGAEYFSMTCVGLRLVDALWILGDYEEDYDAEEAYSYHYVHQKSPERWQAMVRMHDTGEGIRNIQNSSLITINIGANDVFTYPKNSSTDPDTNEVDYELLITRLIEGYNRFQICYPMLLERIRALNPYCDIVIVGQFNPYKNFSLNGEAAHTLGALADTYINNMNTKTKAWAVKYDATYVDITDISDDFPSLSLSDENFLSKFGSMDNHPKEDDHQVIAADVIAALDVAETQISLPTSGILRTELNGANMGQLIYRNTDLGWTIRALDGRYVCFDTETQGIVLRNEDPTVWSFSDGFYTTYSTQKTILVIFGIPINRTYTSTVYLTSAGGTYSAGETKGTTALYAAN